MLYGFAKSEAKTAIINSVDSAVLDFFETKNISYSDISKITKNKNGEFLGIEIDSVALNKIKAEISKNTLNNLKSKKNSVFSVPAGSLTGNPYLSGYGPEIHFKIAVSESSRFDFKSEFLSAGINQTLHRIVLTADVSATMMLLHQKNSFSVQTSFIIAQTVIVGATPDSFTNVTETPGDDTADDIFNYTDTK